MHAGEDAVFVVDAQHLAAGQQLAIEFGAGRLGLGRRGTGQRYADAEHAALAWPGTHLQPVFEYPAQAIGNRQAEAEAFLGAGLVAVQALELLEDDLELVLRDTRAAIPHRQAQLSA
ncbi:hypothetical protein D3C72_2127390 [compost metagenome]